MKRNTFIKALFGLPFVLPLLGKAVETKEDLFSEIDTQRLFFTPEMIVHKGLIIIRAGIKITQNTDRIICWKLTYDCGSKRHFGMTGVFNNGMIFQQAETVEEMCRQLNNSATDGWRILTKEELIYLIKNK